MKIFKVLEVTNEFNNSSSYTVSCVVKNMLTGEIISINQENASGLELKIIDKVDNFDLNENDEFIIRDQSESLFYINGMEKLEKFIDNNFETFSNFTMSEVEEYNVNQFDDDVIEYLKNCFRSRFDYRNICVYLVSDKNKIYVENMS